MSAGGSTLVVLCFSRLSAVWEEGSMKEEEAVEDPQNCDINDNSLSLGGITVCVPRDSYPLGIFVLRVFCRPDRPITETICLRRSVGHLVRLHFCLKPSAAALVGLVRYILNWCGFFAIFISLWIDSTRPQPWHGRSSFSFPNLTSFDHLTSVSQADLLPVSRLQYWQPPSWTAGPFHTVESSDHFDSLHHVQLWSPPLMSSCSALVASSRSSSLPARHHASGFLARFPMSSCPFRSIGSMLRQGKFKLGQNVWFVKQCCQVAEISAKKLKMGRGKIKLAGRICGRILAEFYQKWRKRGRRILYKKDRYLTVLTHFQRQKKKNLNLFSNWPFVCMLNWRFLSNWPNFFQNWPNFFIYWPENNFVT